MKQFIIAAIIIVAITSCHQSIIPSATPIANTEITRNDTVKMLLGHCSPDAFQKEPYKKWWDKSIATYQPDTATISILKSLTANTSIEIFLGSWCGDSRREVPRMVRLLQTVGYSDDSIRIILVDNAPDAYKQSPQHEELGKNIFRVPTFIVYKNNKELGRIIESPVVSQEKDLAAILQKETYKPNYNAVNYWIKKTGKNDQPINDSKMEKYAIAIKPDCKSSALFNSYGYLLMGQKNMVGAINVFKLNTLLFPNDANTFDSLGEAYMKAGDKAAATANYNKVLQLKPGNANAQEMLQKLKS